VYTNTSYFSFQSGDLARSLISFKDGIILNNEGVDALKVYTANCFGLSKSSYNQRIE
jgi:DNA-directed RNA polymerase